MDTGARLAARRPVAVAAALAASCLAVLGLALQQRWGGEVVVKAIDDLGQLTLAWAAAVMCWLTYRRCTGRRRASWAALTVALGSGVPAKRSGAITSC